MHRAEAWLKRYGRPLEAARWDFLFRGGSAERVLHYLSAFQNEDGGFGHGLEPDFWLPASSPMATWMAGQILVEVQAAAGESMVKSMLDYLIQTPQVQPGMWASVLPGNNQYPHAPWWHWQEDAQEIWMFNPSVELAALLLRWSPEGSVGARLGWESLKRAVPRVMQAASMERHELSNYRKCVSLLAPHKERFNILMEHSLDEVRQKLDALTRFVIDKDVCNWDKGYKALPLDFIQSPYDPLYHEFRELVHENLRFYLAQRTEDGLWGITWSWVDFPEDFAVARRYWQGILAVERHKVLKAFEEDLG